MKSRISMLALVFAVMLAVGSEGWSQYAPPSPGAPGFYNGAYPAAYSEPNSVLAPGTAGPASDALDKGAPPPEMGYPSPYGSDGAYHFGEGYNCGPGCDPSLIDGGCPPSYHWIDSEFLLWYTKGRSVPPLVTTSPLGTPQGTAGVLGEPGTTLLFGNEQVGGDSVNNGGRITAGWWLDQNHENALMLRLWYLDGREAEASFSETGPGRDILAIPFFNVGLGAEDALLVSFLDPGIPFELSEGSINFRDRVEFISAEVLARLPLERGCGFRLDLIGGYQMQRINNDLDFNFSLISLDPGGFIPVGTVIDGRDSFATRNEFHGGTIGLNGEWQRGPWLFKALGKVGIGNMEQRVRTQGSTTISVPFIDPITTSGGLFTQDSNIGEVSRNKICFVPEVNFTLSYQLTCHIDLSIGYSMVYWSSVAMAGDQINRNIDFGGGSPALPVRDSDTWVQGANVGLLFHW